MEPTRISVRVQARVNIGNYEHVEKEIIVQDYVREGIDKNSGAALDRVHTLAEAKLAEYLDTYKDGINDGE